MMNEAKNELTLSMHPTKLDVVGFLFGLGLNSSSGRTALSLLFRKRMEGPVNEYPLNASKATGTSAGESTGGISVNSTEKLLTSRLLVMLGTKGAGMLRRNRSSQLMDLKKG